MNVEELIAVLKQCHPQSKVEIYDMKHNFWYDHFKCDWLPQKAERSFVIWIPNRE